MKRRTWMIATAIVMVFLVGGAFMKSQTSVGAPEQQSELARPDMDNAGRASYAVAPGSGIQPQAAPSSASDGYLYESGGMEDANAAPPNDLLPGQRLVIKSASVEGQVDYEQLDASLMRVEQMIAQMGGYIVSTDDSTALSSSSAYAAITFRVPSERFNDALNGLEGEGITITRRDISGEDVTDEYVDNESRLKNLEATAAQLRTLLSQAKTVKDTIEVMDTLTQYEQEIELIKGRQKYLEESASMSAITFTLRSNYTPAPAAGWTPKASLQRAWSELVEFGQGLVDFAIVVAVWTPVWLPLLLVGLFIWRLFRRIVGRIEAKFVAKPHESPSSSEAA